MEVKIPTWLLPIIALGGIGVFIDFLLGKSGQDKVKENLTEWWISFDDVSWSNFGRKEALFAANLLEKWCGNFLSGRRIIVISGLFVALLAVCYLMAVIRYRIIFYPDAEFMRFVPKLLSTMISMSVSISLSIKLARILAKIPNDKPIQNFAIFATSVSLTYLMMCIWAPITNMFSMSIVTLTTAAENWIKYGAYGYDLAVDYNMLRSEISGNTKRYRRCSF